MERYQTIHGCLFDHSQLYVKFTCYSRKRSAQFCASEPTKQYIRQKKFAQHRAASFIAQYVTSRLDVLDNHCPIIKTGVGTHFKNAGNACFTFKQSTSSSEQITVYLNRCLELCYQRRSHIFFLFIRDVTYAIIIYPFQVFSEEKSG